MAQIVTLLLIFVFTAISGFAQSKTTDFAGKWTLDTAASKLDERMRIESMTMAVAQTEKEISIETTTKRAAPPEGAPAGRGGGRGGFGGGDGKTTFSLDGKERTVNLAGPMGTSIIKLNGKLDSGKLKTSDSRTMTTQMGEITITTNETWELSADGKKLTVKRESTTPRGSNSSTLVFSKG